MRYSFKVDILHFIDPHQPGWVECVFTDIEGRVHIFHEKVPIVSLEDLDEHSCYPKEGTIACEILKEWTDTNGRKIVTVNTYKPWGIESIEGLTEFNLFHEQITSKNND